MGVVNYEPIIADMTWSYSRIKAFDQCPYRWYLKYIRHLHGEDMFFASYGSFMHKLIELYYTEHKTSSQLVDMYLGDFASKVVGRAPNPTVFQNYLRSGLQYLKNIQPLPYNAVAIEKEVNFTMSGIPFIGYIDFLGEKDGDLYIVDNKSRTLKPRSTRSKPTKADAELDEYLIQLYLYSAAIEQEFGKLPKALCFNCFRVPLLIEEPFTEQAYVDAKQWLEKRVSEITVEKDFNPNVEYFKCNYLCELSGSCDYCKLALKN